jgi:hypothetical protein
MADDCDCGFLVWDARSSGTLNNVVELVARRKAALVYVNKAKHFLKVKDAKDFDALLGHMTEAALMKADRKIGVLKKIEALKFSQPDFLNLGQADPANRRSA